MQLSLLSNWFSNELVKALSWTFVHSLWQGLLAALLAAIIISTTRRSSARLRYNLLGMVLILFIAAAAVTFSVEFAQQTTASVHAVVPSIYSNQLPETISDNIAAAPLPGGFINELGTWFDDHNNLFFLGWALFFLLNCVKLFAGLAAVNRLRHYKTYPVTNEWKTKLTQLSDLLGIRQSIALLQSELVKVPVVLGILKPVILLPAGLLTQIPPEQVEAILLHELGHIRRKDYFVNFLQHFAEAIFFFNPAMLWVSSLLRQEREACCDDIAVDHAAQKRNYLDAIVSFQEYSLSHSPYVMAISTRKNHLLNRVKRIITRENKALNIVEKLALLAGIIIFSAFTFITPGEKLNKVAAFVPLEQMVNLQPLPLKDNITKTETQSVGKEKKKFIASYRSMTDTVPAKKDTTVLPVIKNIPEKKAIRAEDDKIRQTLNDIQQIKDKIGAKKEIIGEQKEQLKESPGKEEYLEKIKKAREEVEAIRKELELKRKELYIYQKEVSGKSTSSSEVNSSSTTSIDVNDDRKDLFATGKKSLLFKTKKIDIKANQFKVETQELRYKMDLQVKMRPTFKKITEPTNPKTPPAPGKKTAPTVKKTAVI